MFARPLSGVELPKFPALFLLDLYDVPKPTKESGDSHWFCSLATNPRRARETIGP